MKNYFSKEHVKDILESELNNRKSQVIFPVILIEEGLDEQLESLAQTHIKEFLGMDGIAFSIKAFQDLFNGINCSKNRAREIISEVIKHEFFHSYQYLYIREKYGSDFLKEILLLEHSKSWENRFLEQEAIKYSKGQPVVDFSNY